jgi:MPBQ/MSBQ methyltransferase
MRIATLPNREEYVRGYDRAIFDGEIRGLYGDSDLYNMGEWDDRARAAPHGPREAARRLVERHLAVDPPRVAADARVVLDAGCGLGGASRMMAAHYPAALVLGINISIAQVIHAARSAPTATSFAVMDAGRLAVASKSVDRIHAIEAAFSFHTRLDFFRDAQRVLRPGGKLILTDILYRRALPLFPAQNVCVDAAEYRNNGVAAGFVVEHFEDLTNRTAIPFLRYMDEIGQQRGASILRRAIAAYCFVVLRNPG